MLRYHITAKKTSSGSVRVSERGLGSFLYSGEVRQNLREVAENIARQTPYTIVSVRPRGESKLPEIYIRAAFNESIRNIHHRGYSTQDFLVRMGLKTGYAPDMSKKSEADVD